MTKDNHPFGYYTKVNAFNGREIMGATRIG